MELFTLILLRSLERLIGVLIGGGLAWLGYRLFLDVPAKADSSGQFNLPGGTAIHLVRVGPGVFFSLFGTGIVFISFLSPVKFTCPTTADLPVLTKEASPTEASGKSALAKTETGLADYSGMGESQSNKTVNQDPKIPEKVTMAMLNRLPDYLKADMDTGIRNNILVAVRQAKIALMKMVWQKEWGDWASFYEWVNSSGKEPSPELKQAVAFFNTP